MPNFGRGFLVPTIFNTIATASSLQNHVVHLQCYFRPPLQRGRGCDAILTHLSSSGDLASGLGATVGAAVDGVLGLITAKGEQEQGTATHEA